MASSIDKVEDKLDRYYDHIMEKLLDMHKSHMVLAAENKELKKEISKLREVVLQIQSDIKVTPSTPKMPYSASSPQESENSPPNNEEGESSSNTEASTPPSSPPKEKSLSKFLEDEISIFDVKVLNGFIKATKDTIKANTQGEVEFIKPRIENNINLPIIVAGKMGLTRSDQEAKGSMAIAFEKKSILTMTKDVLMMPPSETPNISDCKDVTSELCNQVCGQSKMLLKKEGYDFAITLPEVKTGQPDKLIKVLGHPKVALSFKYKETNFYILFWG